MLPKTWMEQDFIMIGFSRGAFIATIVYILIYTLIWIMVGYFVGTGKMKLFYWWLRL